MSSKAHHVVIIGGGFGGLSAAKSLRRAPVHLTLIDKRNFHLFQPLLYQVATGGLSPADIASPIRAVLKHQRNAHVLLGEVVDILPDQNCVVLEDGSQVPYETLIIAAGARHHYFGHEQWESLAPGLKTIEDAQEMRRRILIAFEEAERETDPEKQREWLRFIIVGGGPTGVELAGSIAELAHQTLKGNFQRIDPANAEILVIEGTDRVLPPYPPDLSERALRSLQHLGVEVHTNSTVVDITPESVTIRSGDQEMVLRTHTVLWGAGVKASPLGKILAEHTGVEPDRAGRVKVQPDLSVPGCPNIFVLGDMMFLEQDGKPLPGVAQVAMQGGTYIGRLIRKRLKGQSLPSFRYWNKGDMAVIGRKVAVADLKKLHLSGFLAWILWLFIHLMYLVGFENRVIVFIQWAWGYFSRNRRARLILNKS
jgi:NADH dehydrogenase